MSPRATLVLVLLLVVLAAGGAWWFVAGEGAGNAAPVDAGAARAVEPARSAQPASLELAAVPGAGRDRAGAAAVRGAPPSALGVRAEGDGRLAGTVRARTTGQPVPGATVELHAMFPMGAPLVRQVLPLIGSEAVPHIGTGEPLAVVEADAVGAFSFEGVRRGAWFVQARGEREAPDGVERARVSASGDGGPLDVYVRPGGRVLGSVLAPGGEPAGGVRVVLVSGFDLALESLRAGDLCALETETDEEGRFAFPGVPAGPSYDLFAFGRGFAVSFTTGLAVAVGADTEVELRALRGGTLAGRMVARDPESPGAAPVPVAGAHVGAVPHGLRYLPFAAAVLASTHQQTGADGSFVLRHVPPGEVDLLGVAAGHAPSVGPSTLVADGARATAPDFVLEGGPTATGRVMDEEGQPLAGVRVEWQPIDMERFGLGGALGGMAAKALEGVDFPVTAADGRFTAGAFPGEPPYWLSFSKPGYGPRREKWEPGEGELEVELSRGGFVEGIVMDVETLEPVPAFSIRSSSAIAAGDQLLQGGGELSVGEPFEDQGGRFRFGPLRPGSTTMQVDAPGYAMTRVRRLAIVAGESVRGVIVELHPGLAVRGRVVDADGAPVAGATLVPDYSRSHDADREEPPPSEGYVQDRGQPGGGMPSGLVSLAANLGLAGQRTGRSGPDGSFELLGMEAGRVRLAAVHRGHATGWSEQLELTDGEPVPEVRIELTPGGAIHGRVVDRHQQPVGGAMVFAAAPQQMDTDQPRDGDAVCQGRTDAEGRYRIERVGPGTYFLALARGDEALDPMRLLGTLNLDMVTVPPGAEVEYDIVDRSAGGTRVYGHVTSRSGPVGSGQVAAFGFESESLLGFDVKLARIDPQGAYEFESLAPGEYRLQVEAAELDGDASMTIDVPDAPEYRLDLVLPEGRIAGRVVNATTGEPIGGAWVTAESSRAIEPDGLLGNVIGREAGLERDWTDDDGRFSLERLEAARYELSVRPQGWGGAGGGFVQAEPLVVELRPDQVHDDLEIRLEPALVLSGRVRDPDGASVQQATVSAFVEGRPESVVRTATGPDGSFDLSGVAPGEYVVRASHAGFASARLEGVRPEEVQRLELVLEPGIAVTALVLGTRGEPVSGAVARLSRVRAGDQPADPADAERVFEGLFEGRGVTGAEGRLELGHFGAGEYLLEAQRGADRASQPVTLVPGSAPVEVSIRLR